MRQPVYVAALLVVLGAVLAYWHGGVAPAAWSDVPWTDLRCAHRSATHAKRLDSSDGAPIDLLAFEVVSTATLRPGDLILCTSNDVIARAGAVIDGVASLVALTAVRGPVPVIHASARDYSRVAGGETVLSGYLIVRVCSPGGGRRSSPCGRVARAPAGRLHRARSGEACPDGLSL